MRTQRLYRAIGVAVLLSALSACDDSPTGPSSGAIATIQVRTETFRVWLQTDEQIAAARAALAGGSASIPNGRIVTGTEFNRGWSWHLEDVTFAQVTIELCDGLPSDVERLGVNFGGGRFCPWTARVTSVEDR